MYCLNADTMPRAAEVYKAGKRGVMRKWAEFTTAKELYEQEIQSAIDVFAESESELPPDFPGTSFDEFCTAFLNESHILFADAGRSKNPYRRTAEQQAKIGAYVMEMAVLFVRVRAAVLGDAHINPFMQKLRDVAKRVQDAAKWAVQRAFPDHPVFVGPLVAADIMLAGFKYAEARYHHQVSRAMGANSDTRDLSHLYWGPAVEQLSQWARTVKPVKRVSPKRKTKAQRQAISQKKAGNLWSAAAATPSGLQTPSETARQLDHEFSSAKQPDDVTSEATRFRTDSGSSVDMRAMPAPAKGIVYYGVGRGRTTGVFTDWDLAHAQVLGFTGQRLRKFKTEASAKAYVAKVQAENMPTWYVLKKFG